MYQKIGILAVLASVLLSAGLLATPSLKVANAQGNETQGNQTKKIDVDGWIKTLKENHPALANVGEAQDVKDVIGKFKDMDGKEAVKQLLALRVLNDLMELKASQEGQ